MRVLFLTHEPLTESIAGPSIRVWELAHVLARAHNVTIGTPNEKPRTSPAVRTQCFTSGALEELLKTHDVTIAFGYLLHEHPMIRRLARYLVMDIYGPFVLENMQMYGELGIGDRMAIHERGVEVLLEQLEQADFLICASERQRDYWLGALTVADRINPYTSGSDPSLRSLIDVVPFGLPPDPPRPTARALKGVVPEIGSEAVVVLWTGGVWDWFDPLTAIEAVSRLQQELPQLKLYFMGVRHPNPRNPEMAMARRARELARERGVLDRAVFLNDRWVPYEQRVNYLCDADFAISLHREHVETRFSFRTRFLDCLWAGLPIVATRGDVLCDAAVQAGAGLAIDDGDVDGAMQAMRQLTLDAGRRRQMAEKARAMARDYTWEKVAQPLVRYCSAPYRAADAQLVRGPRFEQPGRVKLALAAYRLQGFGGVSRRLGREVRVMGRRALHRLRGA